MIDKLIEHLDAVIAVLIFLFGFIFSGFVRGRIEKKTDKKIRLLLRLEALQNIDRMAKVMIGGKCEIAENNELKEPESIKKELDEYFDFFVDLKIEKSIYNGYIDQLHLMDSSIIENYMIFFVFFDQLEYDLKKFKEYYESRKFENPENLLRKLINSFDSLFPAFYRLNQIADSFSLAKFPGIKEKRADVAIDRFMKLRNKIMGRFTVLIPYMNIVDLKRIGREEQQKRRNEKLFWLKEDDIKTDKDNFQ